MIQHSETRFLPYSAEQVYALVADVASYPAFLPWTAAARVRSITPRLDHDEMQADLVISFKVFREKFGSEVKLYKEAKRIETRYIDGPFSHMNSTWGFKDVEGGCEVSFSVDFAFRNPLLQGAAGMFFQDAMLRIVRAFEERAQRLYGAQA